MRALAYLLVLAAIIAIYYVIRNLLLAGVVFIIKKIEGLFAKKKEEKSRHGLYDNGEYENKLYDNGDERN